MRISDWSSDVCSSDLNWTSSLSTRTNAPRRGCSSASNIRSKFPASRTSSSCAKASTPSARRVGRSRCRAATSSNSRARRPDCSSSTWTRSEEHTSELQSLMRISYAVFCLNKKKDVEKEKALTKLIQYECRIDNEEKRREIN